MSFHWQTLLHGLIVLGFYAFALWRIVRTNQGNKVIDCASIAILLVFVFGILSKLNAPDWLLESLGVLLLLMCFLTVGLYILKGYRFLKQRPWKSN
jgi:hypothetical protein